MLVIAFSMSTFYFIRFVDFFFFFFLIKDIGGKGSKRKRRYGNAARKKSGCSPFCHMMGTKVCTSVNRTSRPASCGWNKRVYLGDSSCNTPVFCDQRILKSQSDCCRIPFKNKRSRICRNSQFSS